MRKFLGSQWWSFSVTDLGEGLAAQHSQLPGRPSPALQKLTESLSSELWSLGSHVNAFSFATSTAGLTLLVPLELAVWEIGACWNMSHGHLAGLHGVHSRQSPGAHV